MGIEAKTNQYWIAPNVINISLNALGNPNRIQGSVASGAVISCYIEGVEGLGLDNGRNPKRWQLNISPTYFNSNTAKYVYVAIPHTSNVGTQAVVVFPSEKIDIYGKNAEGEQVGSTDYYYVWLQAIISSSGEYGNVNRTWTSNINFGSLGTYEDIMDMSETDWYSYSKVSQIVTFLKPIFMKAGSYFQNLILGDKELKGVATAATDEEFIDSDTLVATPNFIGAHYLRKDAEDTATEQIGFLKGLWVGIQGLYEITAEGIAKFKSLFVDDITAQRMQVDDMQSSNYTGDGIADTGWRLTNSYNGHSKLTIDELYVRMKAVFEALEVKKELVTGGNQVQSCAASVISKVDYLDANKDILGYDTYKIPFTLRNAIMMLAKGQNPFGSYSRNRTVRLQLTAEQRQSVRYVRCYFLAKEGDRKIQNWWRVADPNDNTTGNDLARCQTFNLASDSVSERDNYWGDSGTKQGNIFWWRKLAGVSSSPVEIDGKMYHYFDVYCNPTAEAATPYTYAGAMQGSDIPAPGDEVSQWGNDNNIDRMNLIVHEVNGSDAAIKMYEGINQFSIENGLYGNPLKIRFAPKTGCKVNTTKWEVVTENFVAPIPVECGNWTAGTVAKYYEIWQHNGGSWLCVASNGGSFKVIEAFTYNNVSYSVGDTVTQATYDTFGVNQQMCCARLAFGTTTDEPSTSSAAWRQYAAKGEKGDNAIRMDIDNEYDSIQYQGDGVTKVSPSATVQTTAYLFDGVTDKSSDATFTISNRSGMNDQQATISGRVVTVSGLTSDGEVTIRAEYPVNSGKYYYAKFTVKKLIGIDKYDLVVTPNAVPVNTSNTVADTTIGVQVYRTPANGGTRHLVEFTNKTTNDYGLTLSVKDSLNNNLTETTGTGTVTTRTFNLTGTMATNADNVMIVLTKDSKTQDSETVPITHVHNGIDGTGSNAVKIDLDNEMDSIPCDSDGKVMSQTVLEVNARIYDGASPVSSGVAVSSVGAIAGVSAVTSVSSGVVNIKWTIPATGSGTPLSVDKYTSQIVLTWGGNSYYATFTANVVKSGEPGVSPTIFQLLPSPSQISFKRNSSGTIPSSTQTLLLTIKKSDGNGTDVITVAASGLTVRYRTDQVPSSASDGTAWPAAGLSISSSVTYGNVYIAAFDSNGTLIDRETVAIVKDGVNGQTGPAGKDGWMITADPANVIITQNMVTTSNFTTAKVGFTAKKGNVAATISSIGTPTSAEFNVAKGTGDDVKKVVVSSPKTHIPSGATSAVYYSEGSFVVTVNVTDPDSGNTVSFDVTVLCYANLMGSFKTAVEGDVETSVAQKLTYGYDPNSQTVLPISTFGQYIRSSEENISVLTKKVDNGKNLLSGVLTGEGWTDENYDDAYIDNDGWISGHHQQLCSPYTAVSTGSTYTVSFEADTASDVEIYVVNGGTETYVETIHPSRIGSTNRYKATFTAYEGTIMLTFDTFAIYQPQLELGSDATAFEADTTETSSRIKQTANEIDASVRDDLGEVGININGLQKSVRIKANDFTVTDSNDNPLMEVSQSGGIKMMETEINGSLKVVNSDNSITIDGTGWLSFSNANQSYPSSFTMTPTISKGMVMQGYGAMTDTSGTMISEAQFYLDSTCCETYSMRSGSSNDKVVTAFGAAYNGIFVGQPQGIITTLPGGKSNRNLKDSMLFPMVASISIEPDKIACISGSKSMQLTSDGFAADNAATGGVNTGYIKLFDAIGSPVYVCIKGGVLMGVSDTQPTSGIYAADLLDQV